MDVADETHGAAATNSRGYGIKILFFRYVGAAGNSPPNAMAPPWRGKTVSGPAESSSSRLLVAAQRRTLVLRVAVREVVLNDIPESSPRSQDCRARHAIALRAHRQSDKEPLAPAGRPRPRCRVALCGPYRVPDSAGGVALAPPSAAVARDQGTTGHGAHPNRAEAFNAALFFQKSKAHLQLHSRVARYILRFDARLCTRRTYIRPFPSIVRPIPGGSRSGLPVKRMLSATCGA